MLELKDKNNALSGKLAAYEQLICSTEDLHTLIEQQKSTIEVISKEKNKLETLFDATLKRLELTEKRNLQLNKKLNNTLLAMKEKGEQTDLLKNYIQEFKAKTHIYVPINVYILGG